MYKHVGSGHSPAPTHSMAPCCPADELQVLSLALRGSSWCSPASSPPTPTPSSLLGLHAAPDTPCSLISAFAHDVPSVWNASSYVHWVGSYLSLGTPLWLTVLWKPGGGGPLGLVGYLLPYPWFLHSGSMILTFLPDQELLKARPASLLPSPQGLAWATQEDTWGGAAEQCN